MWELYKTFFKMGAFTFGGGYAMLPLLQQEVVEKKKWATEEELIDYYAIGQSTPGIIAVNTATFVGHKTKGVPGALAATLGLITPSILIILLIAQVLGKFSDRPVVGQVFRGIRIAVCALVLQTVYKMAKTGIENGVQILIFVATFIVIAAFKVTPILPVVVSAGIYLLWKGGGR